MLLNEVGMTQIVETELPVHPLEQLDFGMLTLAK